MFHGITFHRIQWSSILRRFHIRFKGLADAEDDARRRQHGLGILELDVRSSGPTNDSGRTIHIAIEYRWRSNFVLALTKVVWLRMSVAVVATTPRADFGTNDRGRQSFYHSAVQRNERTISTALDPRGFPRPR